MGQIPYDLARLRSLQIHDAGMIFDPVNGSFFSVNEVGIEIINALKEEKPHPEIIDILLEHYDVSREELESDLIDMCRSLKDNYLM